MVNLYQGHPRYNDYAPLQQATFEHIAGRQLENCPLDSLSMPDAIATMAEQLAMLSPKVDG